MNDDKQNRDAYLLHSLDYQKLHNLLKQQGFTTDQQSQIRWCLEQVGNRVWTEPSTHPKATPWGTENERPT